MAATVRPNGRMAAVRAISAPARTKAPTACGIVTPEVAELALQRALAYGAVPKAQCATATSSVLRGLPGFSSIPSTLGPKKVMRAFGELPGVTERVITDNDALHNHGVLLVQAQEAPL
jgi:hypothetical protein